MSSVNAQLNEPVEVKTMRIRTWVTMRLKELEDQNARLIEKNAHCNKQLSILKCCAENNSIMWNSAEETVLRRAFEAKNNLTRSLQNGESGGNAAAAAGEGSGGGQAVSKLNFDTEIYENICDSDEYSVIDKTRTENSNFYTCNQNATSGKNLSSRVSCSKVYAVTGVGINKSASSENNSNKKKEISKKPLPTPRKKSQCLTRPNNLELNTELDMDNNSSIYEEFDNSETLESGEKSFDCDSLCNLVSDADQNESDYVNLQYFSKIRNSTMDSTANGQKMTSRLETYELLEQRLKSLAQSCLRTSTSKPSLTPEPLIITPRTSADEICGANVIGDISHSSTQLCLPVFTTYGGNQKLRHSPSSGTTESSSITRSSPNSDLGQLRRQLSRCSTSSSDSDYAIPPDAGNMSDNAPYLIQSTDTLMSNSLHCTETNIGDQNIEFLMHSNLIPIKSAGRCEKAGYLNKVGDKLKSWKRRWFVLRNGELVYYRSQHDTTKKPLGRYALEDITSVNKVSNDTSAFEVATQNATLRLTSELKAVNMEWVKALHCAMNENVANKVDCNTSGGHHAISGWVTKVKYGHSKRLWCILMDKTLLFYKTTVDKVPIAQLNLKNLKIQEILKSSDESASDDDTSVKSPFHVPKTVSRPKKIGENDSQQYSLSLQCPKQDPTYLVFADKEDRDKWFYHLNLVNGTLRQDGTEFERLIQKLMLDSSADNLNWSDSFLTKSVSSLTEPLTTISNDQTKKDALQLYKSNFMFASVQASASAFEYHVDLAQNILAQALKANSELQDEYYCQLIKLTCTELDTNLAWHLLAHCLSLVLPSKYLVMWLLRKHLERSSTFRSDKGKYAMFCLRALERTFQQGGRLFRPSRIEVLALLSRHPFDHVWPYSIPVHLSTCNYQIMQFDGSSTVQECLLNLCKLLDVSDLQLNGFALYIEEASGPTVIEGSQKICDVISQWEQKLMETQTGKFPVQKSVKLILKKRYFWMSSIPYETPTEKLLLCQQLHAQIRSNDIPVNFELACELSALVAQIKHGNLEISHDVKLDTFRPCNSVMGTQILPPHLITSGTDVQSEFEKRWKSLENLKSLQCAQIYLEVLRFWPQYGSTLFKCVMRTRTEESTIIGVNQYGLDLLNGSTKELQVHYSFESLSTFGGCKDDFMLIINRKKTSDEVEANKERLIFAMSKPKILELTHLIADYIRLRKLILPKSSQTMPRSPRKTIDRNSSNNLV